MYFLEDLMHCLCFALPKPSSALWACAFIQFILFKLLYSWSPEGSSIMSFISRSLNFFVIFYCTYLFGVSISEPNSHDKNIEQSENKRRRPMTTHSTPIACRVCDKIFFDNVSLVLHFECHLEDEIPTPGDRPLSLSTSKTSCSLVERTNEAHHSMPPSSLDAGWKSSKSISQKKASTSSLRQPLFHSQLSESRAAHGLAAVPLQLNEQNGKRRIHGRKPQMKHSKKPCKDIIVISDDEEDGNNSPKETLDLTLKL